MNRRLRIFLGLTDIAGQLNDYRKGYESLGHRVCTIIYTKTQHFKSSNYDLVRDDLYPSWLPNSTSVARKVYSLLFVKPLFVLSLSVQLLRSDVIHVMWMKEKFWQYLLPLCKVFGKTIIVSFVGSDVRWRPLYLQEFDMLGLEHGDADTFMRTTERQKLTMESFLQTLRVGEKYADVLLSYPDQAQLALRPYSHFYIPIDYQNISCPTRSNTAPVVSLAATEWEGKDSGIVLSLLEGIRNASPVPFTLQIISNFQHEEVISMLSQSDIVVYSPFTNGPGKFGLEALAAGCVLLTGNHPEYIQYPPDSPIVNITSRDLAQKLLYYLKHPAERQILCRKGREWIEKYFGLRQICEGILNKTSDLDHRPDYFPNFFRNHATFNSQWDTSNAAEVCNRWTRYVSSCSWYKVYVPPGERTGLRF